MVFGGIDSERLQLNEGTLWAAGPYDPANLQAPGALAGGARLIFEGKLAEANRIVGRRMMAHPLGQMPYQTLGDLLLEFPPATSVRDYRRDLNLDTAIATTSYTANEIRFTREVFASVPDQVIAIRLTANVLGRISLTARLKTPRKRQWLSSMATLCCSADTMEIPRYSRETHVRCRREDPQRGRYQDRRA